MASSSSKRKLTLSNTPIRVCPFHPRKKIVSVCNTCGEQFVCTLCISALHMGHKLVETEDYLNVKKHSLHGLMMESEDRIKAIDEKIDKISKVKEENKSTNHKVMKAIQDRGEELKAEIDKAVQIFKEQCIAIEEKNAELVEKVKDKLLAQLTDLHDVVAKCKAALGPDKYVDLASLERAIRTENSRPLKGLPVLQTVALAPGEKEPELGQQLKILYGSLTLKDWRLEPATENNDDDLMSTTTSNTAKATAIAAMKASLIKAIASFRHPAQSRIVAISPIMDGKAWLVRGGTYEGHLMMMTGDIKQTTTIENYLSIIDIMLRADTLKTIICASDGSIRNILQNGKTGVMFRTRYTATSLCEADASGSILVCHDDGRLVKYSKDGEVLQTIDKDSSGRKLFSLPIRVRVNKRTGDIAVIEDSLPRHVIVMDRRCNVLYRFHGDIITNEISESFDSEPDLKKFIPSGICFDRNNNLIISDLGSKTVLLLDRRGRNARTIWRDGNIPTSVGTQPNGDLWVGFSNGKVKVIRYLAY